MADEEKSNWATLKSGPRNILTALGLNRHGHVNTANQRKELDSLNLRLNIKHELSNQEKDLYWENDRLGKIYDDVRKHLQIEARSENWQNNLKVLSEAMDRHWDVQHTIYGHNLEWYIIVLIAVEVVDMMYRKIMKTSSTD